MLSPSLADFSYAKYFNILLKIRNFNLIHEIYFKNKNKYNDNIPKVVKIPFHFMLFSNNNSLDAILTNQ